MPCQRGTDAAPYTATADRSSLSLSTLAVGLGHDVGNSVLPILCHVDSLLSQDLPEPAKADVRAIQQAALHLRRLSSALSLFSIDVHDLKVTSRQTPLREWWDEVEPIMRHALPAPLTLISNVPEDLPPVKAPTHQLTQAVLNLLVNAGEAIDHGEPGEVRVTGRHCRETASVEIAVADNGRGMTDEVRERAMTPFFTTKTRSLSTGLGLSQVKGFVESVGGSVSIESKLGGGTRVVMRLPALVESAVAPAQRTASVAIQNPRVAAHTAALLRCFGFSVQQPPENALVADEAAGPNRPPAHLCILEPSAGLARQVQRCVQAGSAVIVHSWNPSNAADGGVRGFGDAVIVTDGSHRSLHRALQAVSRHFD